jgi:hypothetical protein
MLFHVFSLVVYGVQARMLGKKQQRYNTICSEHFAQSALQYLH